MVLGQIYGILSNRGLSGVRQTITRVRGEAKEDKKARKAAAKQEKQARRVEKKATKQQFSAAIKQQTQALVSRDAKTRKL